MAHTTSFLAAAALALALIAGCAGPVEPAETVSAPDPAPLTADEGAWLAALASECGNGSCEPPEDCNSCPSDCGDCCGNHRCEPPEDCRSCPSDCGDCCGNHKCEPPEDCRSCPSDCGDCCGDYKCEPPEDCRSCPGDCGPCE